MEYVRMFSSLSMLGRTLLTLVVEAFPDVSLQLSGSRLNALQRKRLINDWRTRGKSKEEEGERRVTYSFSRGKVICDSWRDRTGPGVCWLSPAVFLIMNIREEKKKGKGKKGGRKYDGKKKKNMTKRRGGGQRKIPVSELEGVEYRKRP